MKGVINMATRCDQVRGRSGKLPSRLTVTEIDRINRNLHSLYVLFSVVTGFFLALMWFEAFRGVDFLKDVVVECWPGVCFPVFTAYNAFLAIYVTHKQQTRKCLTKRITHRGGRWVALWWLSLGVIALLQVFIKGVKIPNLLVPQCIIVLFVFSGSEALKKRFLKKMIERSETMIGFDC